MNIQEFVKELGITQSTMPVEKNPNMEMDDWHKGASHYFVKLTRWVPSANGFTKDSLSLTTYFSLGAAFTTPPRASQVLGCLISDAATVEDARDFEEWADNLGYDTDSRKAERTYNAIVKQAEELRHFLGDHYDQSLFELEQD